MPPKRMYTRYNMSIAQNEEEPGPSDSQNIYSNKRRKPTPPSPEPVPRSHILNGGGRPRSRTTGNAKGTHKESGKSKKFSGPISLPDDSMDVDEDDPFISMLDLAKSRSAPKLTAGSLYGGGRSGFVSYSAQLKNQKREQLRRAAPVHYVSDDSSVDGGVALRTAAPASSDTIGSSDMDTLVENPSDGASLLALRGGDRTLTAAEASARIFAGEYIAAPSAPPAKTLWKRPIHPSSDLATTWSTNQAASPLLRLPLAVRRTIYAHVLGSHSILFNYLSFYSYSMYDSARYSIAHMRYTSSVYYGRCDPFDPTSCVWTYGTTGMTLLNNVCRQLYLETYTLPYALNDFYFHHNALFNWIIMDDPPRWTEQQRKVFTSITVWAELPVPAILDALPNLKHVCVVGSILDKNEKSDVNGNYDVVRRGNRRELVKETHGVHAGLGGVSVVVGKGGMQGEKGRTNDTGAEKTRVKGLKVVTKAW